jgi:hypothetical protein
VTVSSDVDDIIVGLLDRRNDHRAHRRLAKRVSHFAARRR